MCFLLNLLFDSCYNLDDDEDDYINESSEYNDEYNDECDDKCDDIYTIYEHIDYGIDLLG